MPSTRRQTILAGLALVLPTINAFTLWPFQQKRFSDQGFINAGALGFEGFDGRVVAFGDWNSDQSMDFFTISADRRTLQIYLWDHSKFHFHAGHVLNVALPIESVIPGDFNRDGKLDVVVLMAGEEDDNGGWWHTGHDILKADLYLGGGENGAFQSDPISMDPFTLHQPITIDASGDLKPDFLALAETANGGDPELRLWLNNGHGFDTIKPPFNSPSRVCTLETPHSNAFIDLDGDCLADIFLHCKSTQSEKQSFQIWKNRKVSGFELAGEWDLPAGTGAISFADMDRDGTIDLVFPTCSSFRDTTGIGSDCSINIAYNKQKPLCSSASDGWLAAAVGGKVDCRPAGELCTGDENFGFDLTVGGDSLTSIPITTLFPGDASLLFYTPSTGNPFHPHPIPLKVGDYNLDGFPDLLLLLHNSTAAPPSGGIFGGMRGPGNQVKLLQSLACRRDSEGCDGGKYEKRRRRFEVVKREGVEALDEIWDARGASWMDIDEDGSLDIMIQRTGKQDNQKITFIQNNFFHDAFFLKTLMLNGACDGECQLTKDSPRYKNYGVNTPGATFKFTFMDAAGHRVANQISQMAQTAYNSLNTPYSFFGLGRTNNYLENLFIGSTLQEPLHYINIEGVIPNSQVVVNPPRIPIVNETLPVLRANVDWRKELYLKPGDWIHWVVTALVGIVLMLLAMVYGLHQNEKREDENERRRALHSINFQAL